MSAGPLPTNIKQSATAQVVNSSKFVAKCPPKR